MQLLLVLILALAVLVAVFTLQNQEPIEITIFFWQVYVSKVLVILGSALAGATAVLLAGLFRRRVREKAQVTGGASPEGEQPAAPAETAAPPETVDKSDA